MNLLLLLLIPFCVLGQANEPFRKANLALVTFENLSVDDVFNQTGRTLIDMGYTINKSDRNFLTIETNPKRINGSFGSAAAVIAIRISLKSKEQGKTEVKCSGVFGYPGESIPTTEIVYRGQKGSPFMVAFDRLNAFAKELSKTNPSRLTYAFQ